MKKINRIISILLAACVMLSVAAFNGVAVDAADTSNGSISFQALSLGSNHSAALAKDGSLWMWGSNSYGQVGDGTKNNVLMPKMIMSNVASVTLVGDNSAAVKKDGSLWVWGEMINSLVPKKVLDDVKTVSLSEISGAAIKKDGSLWMWGWNYYGISGNGTASNDAITTPQKIMDGVESVSLGYHNSGAVKKDGSLWMWGSNSFGEVGDGKGGSELVNETVTTPVKVLENVKTVSVGDGYTAAIKKDGSLWMWGTNWDGRLGIGTEYGHEVSPRYINNPTKIMENVESVYLKTENLELSYTAAIKKDGSLWMWGTNTNGQFNYITNPRKIMSDVKKVQFEKESHVCSAHAVTKSDGSLWMWGDNSYGQVGDGVSAEYIENPKKILDGVVDVSLGDWHSGCIKKDGSLWMWGCNASGQIGDNTTENVLTPKQITTDGIVFHFIHDSEESSFIRAILAEENKSLSDTAYIGGQNAVLAGQIIFPSFVDEKILDQITWSVSDSKIAKISGGKYYDGFYTGFSNYLFVLSVQGLKPGKVTITGTLPNGHSTSIDVSVLEDLNATVVTSTDESDAFTKEHLNFISSDNYSNILNETWAYEIADGLNTRKANVAEAMYDVLNTGAELISGEKLSVLNNPYDAILTDLILSQTDSQTTDFEAKVDIIAWDYIKKLSKVCKMADPAWELKEKEYETYLEKLVNSYQNTNDSEAYKYLSKTFKNVQENPTLNEALKGVINGFEIYGIVYDALNTYGDVVNWVAECIRVNSLVSAYLQTSDELKQTLIDIKDQMYILASQNNVKSLNICYNNYSDALADFQSYQTAENIVPLLWKQYMEDGIFKITKAFSGTLRKSAALFLKKRNIASASWIYAAIESYKIGWSISENITQNGDVMDCIKMSRAFYYLEDAALSVVRNDANTLKKNKNYQSAAKFDASYTVLQAVECGAINNYIKQLEADQSSFVRSLKNTGSVKGTGHYNDVEISGMKVQYAKWLNTKCHGTQGSNQTSKISLITSRCPTNIYVYDQAGNEICSIVDGIIHNNELNNGFVLNIIDDEKYLLIPELDKYIVNIVATDKGTMDYTVSTYNVETGMVESVTDYYEVPIVKGEKYKSITTNKTVLTKENKEITPDYQGKPPQNTNGTENTFSDIQAGKWYTDAVYYCRNKGYMAGKANNKFDPNGKVTRATITQVLYAMEGKPAVKKSAGFKDLKVGAWYVGSVNWSASIGIVSGYSKDKFGPDDPITRQQMAAIMYQYAKYKKYDAAANGDISKFKDFGSITKYAVTPMKWAVGHGIISGTNKGLEPKGTATRAQIAVILQAFDKNIRK